MEEKGTDVLANRREFKDPISGNSYYIATPTADDVRGADWQYSKIYTKSLMEGIVTSAEMMDVLKLRGVIGPEFERRQKELTDELSVKVDALSRSTEMDEKQNLAMDVANKRQELYEWNYRLNGPMSNTCEQIADDARLEYLASRLVQNEDGTRVWEDYSDFLTEKNQAFSMRARFEVMLYLQGLDSDFLEKTPEAMAIREIEEDIQSRASEAIAKLEESAAEAEAKEELASEAGVEEDVVEEPKKPKTATKKRTRTTAKRKKTSEK